MADAEYFDQPARSVTAAYDPRTVREEADNNPSAPHEEFDVAVAPVTCRFPGLVGAVKYFLFRKVPGETNWFHTLGSATLTAFLVQLVTGVILAMYYKPAPEEAYASIQKITN